MSDTLTSPHTASSDRVLVNVFTLADHMQVHYRTAQRWTRDNLIPHYRVGKSIRYDLQEVMMSAANIQRKAPSIAS